MPTPQPPLPQFLPSPRELDDVELLRMGALGNLDGVDSMVTLEVPVAVAERAHEAGALELVDPEGVPLAILTVVDSVEGANGSHNVAGPIQPLEATIRRAFGSRYVPPAATTASLGPDVLTVPVSAPLTTRDVEAIRKKADGGPVLFIAMTGVGTPQGVSAHGLVRATISAADFVDGGVVVAVPVAARNNGHDREFRERVVAAYAPGGNVMWPAGAGDLSPEVEQVVQNDRPTGSRRGVVLFFTGLSGSGKSTLAQAVRDRILEDGTRSVTVLDGDRVRRHLSAGLTFSPQDRETNIERIGWVAAEISRHGGMAVCSPIAPFDRTRRTVRRMVEEAGGAFVLVHVSTPLDECERRDRKGLYAKARRGEIEQFTGISSPYEEPTDADLTVDTTGRDVDDIADQVLDLLTSLNAIDTEVAGDFGGRARL